MLREWIRNVDFRLLENIIGDEKVNGTYMWSLAYMELERRLSRQQKAA